MFAKIPCLFIPVVLIVVVVVVLIIPPLPAHASFACLTVTHCVRRRQRPLLAVWLSTAHICHWRTDGRTDGRTTDGRISISHITASFVAPRVMAFFLHAGNITPPCLPCPGGRVAFGYTGLGLLRVALCGESAIFAPDQKWHQTCRSSTKVHSSVLCM